MQRAMISGMLVVMLLATGCAEQKSTSSASGVRPVHLPDVRTPVPLDAEARQEHRAVMLQHLETVQAIVAALADEDYRLAQGLTETHLGFFMHRHAMAHQQPENFPPAYHDLAMVHHEAAEKLADAMPSRDLKQILPSSTKCSKPVLPVTWSTSCVVHNQGEPHVRWKDQRHV